MTTNHSRVVIAGVMALALGAGAQAGEHDTGTPAAAATGGQLHDADTDGDGRLSREEYDKLSQHHGAVSNEPGQGIPATEHQATLLDNFEARDTDGDGYITAEELETQQSGDDR